ncbi:LysR substrate-binding domain-containing protein [Caulobacter sp. LjRoot300]|uniref:LysR substrate-binding domain-containing protein n=1 Tax=Caulobacter sp. LjRoot300 TaxID=3342321 RepID=UPI003ED0C8CE
MQNLLHRLMEVAPGLEIDLVEGDARGLGLALSHGRLDIGFLLTEPRALISTPAWRERVMIAVPADDYLADTPSLAWSDLADRRLLVGRPIAEVVCDLAARRLGAGAAASMGQASCPASVARLVALGQGLGLVNEGDAARVTGVVYRQLARAFLAFDAVLGRRPEKPILRRLMALLAGTT